MLSGEHNRCNYSNIQATSAKVPQIEQIETKAEIVIETRIMHRLPKLNVQRLTHAVSNLL